MREVDIYFESFYLLPGQCMIGAVFCTYFLGAS